MNKKRILIFGAGVIGSIYAAKFAKSGHEVFVLARNKRLLELQKDGLIIAKNGKKTEKVEIHVVKELKPDDTYDYVFVILRHDHLTEVLPILQQNQSRDFVFMVNTPLGYDSWIKKLGTERVIPAFPGAGGKIENGVVHYSLTPRIIQPTTMGEIGGKRTPRIKELRKMFRKAGFPTSISTNMDAWQKSHIAMVCPLAYGIYYDGGNNYTLAKNKEAINQMIRSLKETFQFLKQSKIGITPFKLNLFRVIPATILYFAIKLIFKTKWAETVISNHAVSAKFEMELLMNGFLNLAKSKGIELEETKKLIRGQ